MIISAVMQGLLYGILGLGIYLTFRILDFPDLTTEGSFPLGGAVTVALMNAQVHPILATLGGVASGCLAGLITGLLYTRGKIPTILSGILVMLSTNSIMLMFMGRANLRISHTANWTEGFSLPRDILFLLLGLGVVVAAITALIFFLNTRLGQAYVATGDNRDMARSFGINTDAMEILGLVVSNGLIALSGSLISQMDGYADVSKGIGVIVIGLASIIIGEVLYHNLTLLERLVAIIVGAIFYWGLITLIIAAGFSTSYLKLYSAVILAVCLMIPVIKEKLNKGGRS